MFHLYLRSLCVYNIIIVTRFQEIDIHIRHAKELKNVKKILFNEARDNSLDGLRVIDMIQRLGIEYHFEEEIQEAVQNHYLKLGSYCSSTNHDLQLSEVSLQFRLLRQHCYHVDTGKRTFPFPKHNY